LNIDTTDIDGKFKKFNFHNIYYIDMIQTIMN